MNSIEVFLKRRSQDDSIRYQDEIIELYEYIPNEDLAKIFASYHTQLNESFKIMNHDIRSQLDDEGNYIYIGGYFHAQDSRDLIEIFEKIENLKNKLSSSEYTFSIREDYAIRIRECKRFLFNRNGSTIPEGLVPLELTDYEAIFILSQSITLTRNSDTSYSRMRSVGEGSYARVFAYVDPLYGTPIALKRAKTDLDSKELERFHQEYEVLKSLKSPYVVEAFSFDTVKNEYTMEYMDESIYDFIRRRNDSLTIQERKRIIVQICQGLKYIHGKGLMHRDISLKNVLIKHYDDVDIVKIGDFGLVKVPESTLTSLQSECKGSLNDPDLVNAGFSNYEIRHDWTY